MEIDQYQLNNQIYTFGMIIKTMVEAIGMFSDNLQKLQDGNSMIYSGEAFTDLILNNCCHHNGIISNLYPERR